jgi:hypothetical protein
LFAGRAVTIISGSFGGLPFCINSFHQLFGLLAAFRWDCFTGQFISSIIRDFRATITSFPDRPEVYSAAYIKVDWVEPQLERHKAVWEGSMLPALDIWPVQAGSK